MGWGTTFTAEIYLSRQTFQSKGDLEDFIRQTNEDIRRRQEQIFMFCSSNVRDLVPKEWEERSVVFIHDRVTELMNEIFSDTVLLCKLQLLLENYDTAKSE